MTLGPFLFLAPLALLGVIALPVIWWILRATPPMPKEADLPSLRLLDGLDPRDETPSQTPWWILLLRIAAAALAVLGLAQPIYAPGADRSDAAGPLLIVLDDGWSSADRWGDMLEVARGQLTTSHRDRAIHLLTTAPRSRPIDPAERLDRSDLASRIASLDPVPWGTDPAWALARLSDSGLQPGEVFWISDGLTNSSETDLAAELAGLAPLTVFAAPPRGGAAITGLAASATGVNLSVARTRTDLTGPVFISALSEDGLALATETADFPVGELRGEARFTLPPAALARINRFSSQGGEAPARSGSGTAPAANSAWASSPTLRMRNPFCRTCTMSDARWHHSPSWRKDASRI